MGILDLFRPRPQPEAKASAAGSVIASFFLGRPVWSKRALEQLALEGYQRNVIVYACVWLTARAAAHVPIDIVQRGGTTDGAEVDQPDLAALLERPSPDTDGITYRQAVISDLLLYGNSFQEQVSLAGKPRELYRLPAQSMKIVPGKFGWPEAYELTVNSNTIRWPNDPTKPLNPILHLKDYNPTDSWWGMSPLDPAAFAVDAHTAAQAWNKALIDNGAAPSGALVFNPKEGSSKLSEDQWSRLKAELDQNFSGSMNAGRPLLLDGGLDWKALGLSPKDMDFVEGQREAARAIALAMGVPPMILGIPGDNTYSNYQEAQKAWYRQTILPVLSQWCRGMSWWICPAFGKGIAIEPDLDDLPVFADERQATWDRIAGAEFLTVNEKREALGFDKTPGGDVILVPSTMIPLGDAGASITSPDANTPDTGDDVGDELDTTEVDE